MAKKPQVPNAPEVQKDDALFEALEKKKKKKKRKVIRTMIIVVLVLAVVLLILVILNYAIFADFSVWYK